MAVLNPYLNFRGETREAMEFYASVFGGEATLSTFADFQMPGISEDEQDKIMHSQLLTPAGFTLMAADIPESMGTGPNANGTISISGDEVEEIRGYFDKLAEGGRVGMALEKAPWGDYFGQVTDRYGVDWMANISGGGPAA